MRSLAFAAALAAFFSAHDAKAAVYLLASASDNDSDVANDYTEFHATYTLVGDIPNPVSVSFSLGISAVPDVDNSRFNIDFGVPFYSASYEADIQILDNSNTVVQTGILNPIFAAGFRCNQCDYQPNPSFASLTISDLDRTIHVDLFLSHSYHLNAISSARLYVSLPDGVAPVPEPSTWAMMILAFAGIGLIALRRNRLRAYASIDRTDAAENCFPFALR